MRLEHLCRSGAPSGRYVEWPNCPRCGDAMLAAESSMLVGTDRIQHGWCCDGCGHGFSTTIRLLPDATDDLD